MQILECSERTFNLLFVYLKSQKTFFQNYLRKKNFFATIYNLKYRTDDVLKYSETSQAETLNSGLATNSRQNV